MDQYVCVCEYLQKALRYHPFRDLRETLLEVLQDVIVELRASLRHPEPTQRVNGPRDAILHLPDLVSSPDDEEMSPTTRKTKSNVWEMFATNLALLACLSHTLCVSSDCSEHFN